MAQIILTVENVAQKILFCNEIQGQISDGAWENTRPLDHYYYWCSIDEDQVNHSGHIGRHTEFIKNAFGKGDVRCVKDNYSLTRLIQYVEDDMLADVRIGLYAISKIGENAYFAIDKWSGRSHDGSDYDYKKHQALLAKWGIKSYEEYKKISLDEKLYSSKQLKKDLSGLSKCMKTKIGE